MPTYCVGNIACHFLDMFIHYGRCIPVVHLLSLPSIFSSKDSIVFLSSLVIPIQAKSLFEVGQARITGESHSVTATLLSFLSRRNFKKQQTTQQHVHKMTEKKTKRLIHQAV
mmetsp:Transcript_6120/g.17359  ORF Transcript_6120/g.17359 Transcript_6120/m.17359 type:complete len:112 (-) Transcript_6120:408-743(-)